MESGYRIGALALRALLLRWRMLEDWWQRHRHSFRSIVIVLSQRNRLSSVTQRRPGGLSERWMEYPAPPGQLQAHGRSASGTISCQRSRLFFDDADARL